MKRIVQLRPISRTHGAAISAVCEAAGIGAAVLDGWLIAELGRPLRDLDSTTGHESLVMIQGWLALVGRRAGDDAQDSVFEVARPKASPDHPTGKPVALIAAHLANSTKRGDVVLDPFAGSGSTLVACEQLGRVARLVDLDPRYCDVVVRRWEQLTGQQPTRETADEADSRPRPTSPESQ